MDREELKRANEILKSLRAERTNTGDKSNGGSKKNQRRPDPWVCPKCGYVREPYWNHWTQEWFLYDGECEQCAAIKLGQEWLAQYRQTVLVAYGLDKGQYAHMDLNTYKPDPAYPTQAAAKQAMFDLVERWKAGLVVAAARIGIQLYTPKRLGERIFAIWDMPSYVREIKNSYDNGGTAEIEASAIEPAILIMDDLGAEHVRTAEWYHGLMYDILNARWKDQKATLVTTNVPLIELRDRIGDRAFSRLLSLTGQPIQLWGDDYRLR